MGGIMRIDYKPPSYLEEVFHMDTHELHRNMSNVLEKYYEDRKLLRDSLRKWLYDKGYGSFSVKLDGIKIKLDGNEYLSGEDIHNIMSEFNIILIMSKKTSVNNISYDNFMYPIGESVFYEYHFR